MTLWDGLTSGAGAGRSVLHCWNGTGFDTTSWAQVSREAEQMTLGLRNAGVEPAANVAAILTNTPLTVRGILGVWLAGGTLASFPVPARGMSPDEYADQLMTFVEHLRPAAMFVDETLLEHLPEALRVRADVQSWESVSGSGRVALSPPNEDDVAFIQYSSGSTSVPQGCMLTARSIETHLQMIVDMIDAQPGRDVSVSWLPLSHDMGIFGNLLTPWRHDIDLVLSPPERFMFSPWTWFNDIERAGATLTCGTNTALSLAARRQSSARGHSGELKLRTVILGAEPIQWETLERALTAFGPRGMTPEVLMPAYGLAEATLAVTATPRDQPPRYVTVDAQALAVGVIAEVEPAFPSATTVTSGGRPLPGVEILGLESDVLAELSITSPSLAEGYFGDEQRTHDRFVNGTLLTGDLGFGRDGHVYPVGRIDDVISVGGRNVYSCEIESAMDGIDGVRSGCSTIIGTSEGGVQRLTLLVEVRRERSDYQSLAEDAAQIAMRKAAVPLDACMFLEKGSLPKTPTGKIQRYRCRQSLGDGRLRPLATIELAGARAGGGR
jgi:fatty-acyl-CoA synthase